jgi:hypothetical protein
MIILRRLVTAVFATLLLIGSAGSAMAHDEESHEDGSHGEGQCSLSMRLLGNATISQYDALIAADYLAPMQIELRNDGNAPCSGAIRFDASRSSRYLTGPQEGRLSYLLVGESNGNDIIYDPRSDNGRSVGFNVARRSSVVLRPQLRVNGGQAGRSGRYEALIDAVLDSRHDDSRHGESERNRVSVVLAVNVVPSVQANFVGTDAGGGSVATMNLGELVTGQERSIGIQIRANASVDLTISSENHGRLNRDGGGGAVPYDLTFGRQRVDLEQTDSVRVRLGEDGVRGLRREVTVKVGDTSHQRAGRYRDVVTFRISGR